MRYSVEDVKNMTGLTSKELFELDQRNVVAATEVEEKGKTHRKTKYYDEDTYQKLVIAKLFLELNWKPIEIKEIIDKQWNNKIGILHECKNALIKKIDDLTESLDVVNVLIDSGWKITNFDLTNIKLICRVKKYTDKVWKDIDINKFSKKDGRVKEVFKNIEEINNKKKLGISFKNDEIQKIVKKIEILLGKIYNKDFKKYMILFFTGIMSYENKNTLINIEDYDFTNEDKNYLIKAFTWKYAEELTLGLFKIIYLVENDFENVQAIAAKNIIEEFYPIYDDSDILSILDDQIYSRIRLVGTEDESTNKQIVDLFKNLRKNMEKYIENKKDRQSYSKTKTAKLSKKEGKPV